MLVEANAVDHKPWSIEENNPANNPRLSTRTGGKWACWRVWRSAMGVKTITATAMRKNDVTRPGA